MRLVETCYQNRIKCQRRISVISVDSDSDNAIGDCSLTCQIPQPGNMVRVGNSYKGHPVRVTRLANHRPHSTINDNSRCLIRSIVKP